MIVAALIAMAGPCAAQVGAGPTAITLPPQRVASDHPYPGVVDLSVDAADVDHKIIRVRETLPVTGPGVMTLLYPQWETASHAPTAEANALAGLQIRADGGDPLAWRRDPFDVFAFQVQPPADARRLTLDFQYVSSTSPGRLQMEPDALSVQWQSVLLYPAGWYARDIPVRASVRTPAGFTTASSLSPDEGGTSYKPVSLETLVDSPVFGGRKMRSIDLGRLDDAPVSMRLFADDAAALNVSDDYRAKLKTMVAQTGAVFGPPHFKHYDFLVSLSELLPSGGGTEHLRSSENNLPPDFFAHPQDHLIYQDLLAHEFVHSWNGKFRTPAGLWTPDFNTPSKNDLLWVYEGETEYWGIVLAARAGLRTRQQTLDLFAVKAAAARARVGRRWKSLADSSLDPVFDSGHGVTWRDWQGREAYYVEGVLLWLDVDTLIRERTGGRRSLDDFARAFYGVGDHSEAPLTYSMDDLCSALARVAPGDWRAFFDERLNAHDDAHLLDGLRRGGYELVDSDAPTQTARQAEVDEGGLDLRASLGVLVGKGGRIRRLAWDSVAFRAGIGPEAVLTSVNGAAYTDAALLTALRAPPAAFKLGFSQDGHNRVATITGAGAPRYPSLRSMSGRHRLDDILSPASLPAAGR